MDSLLLYWGIWCNRQVTHYFCTEIYDAIDKWLTILALRYMMHSDSLLLHWGIWCMWQERRKRNVYRFLVRGKKNWRHKTDWKTLAQMGEISSHSVNLLAGYSRAGGIIDRYVATMWPTLERECEQWKILAVVEVILQKQHTGCGVDSTGSEKRWAVDCYDVKF